LAILDGWLLPAVLLERGGLDSHLRWLADRHVASRVTAEKTRCRMIFPCAKSFCPQ
jgi:hypothetical protein